jgi:hypothetical protein
MESYPLSLKDVAFLFTFSILDNSQQLAERGSVFSWPISGYLYFRCDFLF